MDPVCLIWRVSVSTDPWFNYLGTGSGSDPGGFSQASPMPHKALKSHFWFPLNMCLSYTAQSESSRCWRWMSLASAELRLSSEVLGSWGLLTFGEWWDGSWIVGMVVTLVKFGCHNFGSWEILQGLGAAILGLMRFCKIQGGSAWLTREEAVGVLWIQSVWEPFPYQHGHMTTWS